MNPSASRYLPLVALAVVVGVGIYFGGGDRLTGEAGAAGCGGGGAAQADLTPLGTPDESTQKTVAEAADVPAVVQVGLSSEVARAEALAAEIISKGPSALADVVQHIRNIGCYQKGSSLLVEVARTLAAQTSVTPKQRQLVAEVLLDAAIHAGSAHELGAARPANQDKPIYTDNAEVSRAVDSLRAGESLAAAPNVDDPSYVDAARAWDCVHRATIDVNTLVRFGVSDPRILAQEAALAVRALPAVHPMAIALVSVLDSTVGETPEERQSLESIVSDDRIHAIARGLACRASVRRGSSLGTFRGALGGSAPGELLSCLLTTGDAEAIQIAVERGDPQIRTEAWRRLEIAPETQAIESAVREALSLASQPAGNSQMTLREEWARIDSVARVFINRPELANTINIQAIVAGLPNVLRSTQKLATAIAHRRGPVAELAATGDADALGQHRDAPKQPLPEWVFSQLETADDAQAPALEDAQSEWVAAQITAAAAGQPSALVGAMRPLPEGGLADAQDRDTWRARAGAAARGGAAEMDQSVDTRPSAVCDATVKPGPLQPQAEAIVQLYGPNTVICPEPGTYTGGLELNWPGVRLLALSGATLEGNLLIAASAVVIGLRVTGMTAIGQHAGHTIVSSSHLGAGGFTATGDVLLLGNTIDDGKTFRSPIGIINVTEHLPATAHALRVAFSAATTADSTGGAATFVRDEDLRLYKMAKLLEGTGVSLRDKLNLGEGGWPTEWIQSIPVNAGPKWSSSLASRPAVGPLVGGGVNLGLIVPLTIGPWHGEELGIVVTRQPAAVAGR